jgi:hypothetical protein
MWNDRTIDREARVLQQVGLNDVKPGVGIPGLDHYGKGRSIAMDGRDRAIVAPALPDCGDHCRDQTVLANLAWLDANGYRIDANREFVVDPDGGGGFAVGLLAESGLTPATRAA